MSERPVSEGSVLDIVGAHPVAHPLSEPVQSPDVNVRSWRDHIPVPPAAVVPRPNNDDWWWSNDWNRPHHKHHQAPNRGVLNRQARSARFRGYKVAPAPYCVSERWAGDHSFISFAFVATHLFDQISGHFGYYGLINLGSFFAGCFLFVVV